MQPSLPPTSFPPEGWNAYTRQDTSDVIITKKPGSRGPSDQVPLQGRGAIVQQPTGSPGPSTYVRVDQTTCQKCLDNCCCRCLFPSFPVDKVGNAVVCGICTVCCEGASGGPLSGFLGQCCAQNCLKCCGCSKMTNCGPVVEDTSCCFSIPCITREPSVYTPYQHREAVALLERAKE